jgi:hypothetical protein
VYSSGSTLIFGSKYFENMESVIIKFLSSNINLIAFNSICFCSKLLPKSILSLVGIVSLGSSILIF